LKYFKRPQILSIFTESEFELYMLIYPSAKAQHLLYQVDIHVSSGRGISNRKGQDFGQINYYSFEG